MTDADRLERWQRRTFVTAWVTYFSFYLVRVNVSVALPGIATEYGLSKTALGGVLTALFGAYAVGQFVNGQVANHVSPRYLVAAGLAASAAVNLAFGLLAGGVVLLMATLWGINGFVQSTGWSATVRTVANWVEPARRTRYSTALGTAYIAGSAGSVLLAGFVVARLGWRAVFVVPGLLCLVVAGLYFLVVRTEPAAVDDDLARERAARGTEPDVGSSPAELLRHTLAHRGVWLAALALFGLNVVRYGFLDWAPTYFFETQSVSVSRSAYQSTAFPLAGVVGALAAGPLSRRLGGHARTAAAMLVALVGAVLAFPHLLGIHWLAALAGLTVVGALSFGPHVLVVSALPMDLGTSDGAAGVTGFVDGVGYVGAALTGVLTGWVVDAAGWTAGIYVWAGGAALAAVAAGALWYADLSGAAPRERGDRPATGAD